MPVTTTIGLPNLSDGADMVPPMLRRNSRDDARSDRHPAPSLVLSMIFSENRYPLFRINAPSKHSRARVSLWRLLPAPI
jgi:hypothetical protein